MSWLISIIIGALVGWAAGKIMHSEHGLIINIVLGWVGSAFGNFLAGLLKISADSMAGNILLSVAGACLVIFIFRLFKK